MAAPVSLVPVSPVILSSYTRDGKTGGARSSLKPLAEMAWGKTVPEVAQALLSLHNAVAAAGGDFRVTELHRDVKVQAAARARYDAWLRAGKPRPGTAGFNSKTMKSDFVALPGKSMHNGGRAIDFHTSMIKFPGVAANKQLDRMWEIMRPLGWAPVITTPTEGQSESWHLDYWGELQGVRDRMDYGSAALIGALLVGHAGQWQTYARVVQALLHRAGFDVGEVDGVIGPKTLSALSTAVGAPVSEVKAKTLKNDESLFSTLLGLPAK